MAQQKKTYIRLIISLGIFVLLTSQFDRLCAQGELPPTSTYSNHEHGGGTQNWMIDQSDNRNIYVANNEGLLEYDGEQWKLYPTENQTLLRSVKVYRDRIYTGCFMDFGYWKADSTGFLRYRSLTSLLLEPMLEDEQVWNIHQSGEWVIFQSLNRIFLYRPDVDEISILDFDHDVVRSFQIDNDIYFQSLGHGLFLIKDGKAQVLSEASIFKEQVIIGIFELNGAMKAVSADARLIHIESQSIRINNIDLLDKGSTIYSAIKISADELALGTISMGVLIMNQDGDITLKYDKADGLTNNTVLSLFLDADDALWTGLDDGVNVIHRESIIRIARFEENIGAVYASKIFNGRLYLGTNQGLYSKDANSAGTNFTICKGTEGQVWNLEVIDNQLFCGHNKGVYVIKGVNILDHINVFDGAWGFRAVPNTDDLIIVGSYSYAGLHVIQKEKGHWSFRNHIADYKMSSRFFEWVDDRSLIVNHEYKGVYRIDLDQELNRAVKVTQDHSLEKGIHSGLIRHDGQILYSKSGGLWVYNVNQGQFVKDEVLSDLQKEEDYITGRIVSENNRLWLFSANEIYSISKDRFSGENKISSFKIDKQFRQGNFGYENIGHLGDNRFLIGTSKGYSIVNYEVASKQSISPYRITDVYVSSSDNQDQYRAMLEGDISLEYNNGLRLSITSNSYDPLEVYGYQYRLNQSEWQQGGLSNTIVLERLDPGRYVLGIRRENDANISASYTFEISKPWYKTNVALISYLLGTIFLFYFINRTNARYYKAEQNRLIVKNQKILELNALETKQQITKMENEKLQTEIENKNRELGISTMHTIKQNELLTSIKSKLIETKDISKLDKVIKLIDKNLDVESDWQLFEKAFNEADRDFFKKVKVEHPELTANDLKLCAYLRLNLSSKEMAPLLNISPRSVEIKRYRLRKKLALDHEVSLTDYIIGL